MSDIQRIKEKFGQSAKDIIASGLNLVQKGSKFRCPNGGGHKNDDRNPSMSWDPNALQFYCFGCGLKIDLYGYYREHLNYTHQEIIRDLLEKDDYVKTDIYKNRATFDTELKRLSPIAPECIDYITVRGITEETVKCFQLMTYKGYIAFPYYRFETVVGVKLRKPIKNPKPKMISITGSKPYLYNAQNIPEGASELIICEGEFDCMILHQCGFPNSVSVGAGATSLSAIIEQAKGFFDRFNYLIVISDNDDAGRKMDEYFTKTFGDKAKLVDKKLYQKKDINEEYILNGSESIVRLIESARFKIEGRRDLDLTPYRGLVAMQGSYIPTGLPSIDQALNDLMPGSVTLIVGRSNAGKTVFTRQVIANAISKNNSVFAIFGEGDQERFLNSLYQSVIGRNPKYYANVKINRRWHKEPNADVLAALRRWHQNKLTLFNKGESPLKTTEELFAMINYELKFKQHQLIVLDNLMSLLSAKASELLSAQADFMQRCCDISKIYDAHFLVVLHPNKSYSKGQRLEFEQISGSSDLANKSDNIIGIVREYDNDKIESGISGYAEILKNRYYSELGKAELTFDTETGLLLERKDGFIYHYTFGIEKYFNKAGGEIEDDCPF